MFGLVSNKDFLNKNYIYLRCTTWCFVKNTHWEMISVVKPINIHTLCSYHFVCLLRTLRSSLLAQLIKNMPAMRETWVRSLGWKDPLENERLPTPVFWPGEFHELHSPWCCKESDTTEQLSLSHFHLRTLQIYSHRKM